MLRQWNANRHSLSFVQNSDLNKRKGKLVIGYMGTIVLHKVIVS